MSILAVYNFKGGVGKTSSVVNLAYLSAQEQTLTLLWDLDAQGASTFYFGSKPGASRNSKKLVRGRYEFFDSIRGSGFPNLDLLPADFSFRHLDHELLATKKPLQRLKKLLQPLHESYGHVFLDCPDGLSTLTENIIFAADVLLIPVIPTTLALRTYGQIRAYLDQTWKAHPPVLPFLCMVDRRKKLHKEICAEYAGGKDGFLTTTIPFASAVERMGVKRAPLPSYDHRNRATLAYQALWEEVKGKL